MTEGTVAKWLKQEGDEIASGDEVAEIETDKATMGMTSFDEGVIHKIYIQEGQSAPLGGALALVLEDGEEPPENADQPPQLEGAESAEDVPEPKADAPAASAPEPTAPAPAAPAPVPIAPAATGGSVPAGTTISGDRVKASPLARRLAEEYGVNVGAVRGSGPGGRVVKDDVLMAAAGGLKSGGAGGGIGLNPAPVAAADESIPLSNMRRVIADRLLQSKTTVPHFYLNIEVDAEPMMKLRSQVNEASLANDGPKYTVNDFIMRATVLATQANPVVNSSFNGDSVYQHGEVHLSIAVAIDDGLVTPVIRSAQGKNMRQLSEEIRDLAGRARDKKLTPDEMSGGTITISNLGNFGIGHFDAIINPPQAAILSIGTITKQPVVNAANEIVPGMRMWIGMSCDHRVVDGAVGAAFLSELKRLIETPVLLVA